MKFLTIRQPWASLIAVGAKTIETRPFSTKYRGPLAIHAGLAKPTIHTLPGFTDVTGEPIADGHDFAWLDLAQWPGPDRVYDPSRAVVPLPFGAVVAVCDLIDVVPTSEIAWYGNTESLTGRAWQPPPSDLLPEDESFWEVDASQKPFGDFTPGRFAWLLDNVRPIDPVPMEGAQGLRDLPADILERIR